MSQIVPNPWWVGVEWSDLEAVGISEAAHLGESLDDSLGDPDPSALLLRWADEFSVDLANVQACLEFLTSGERFLWVASPLALLSYSPRRQRFLACFDLDFPPALTNASAARVGAWLTVLAAEVGLLPTSPQHWLTARLEHGGLAATNEGLLGTARAYAATVMKSASLGASGQANAHDSLAGASDYDLLVGQAVWRCVAYAQR